ncbi:MAG TPA: glycosyl hydrolase family 17 protein [Azospirillaceae bacterium]|nr:glycosyl hydrolase family 17 protein [Azospirillaceae bacterium]
MRFVYLLAILALAALANYAVWRAPNLPVDIKPPAETKIASVSFAPFRDGQSPLTQTYPMPAEIAEDMRAIAGQVSGIRTYTSLEGMQVVPQLAEKHGLKVSMGAWLSKKPEFNEAEIASLIDLANRYPDTISRVIVGNEVLLRQELTPQALGGYIDRVRAAVRQPVAYADVWEFWLKYPEMAEHVDIVAIHLLPYWEDEPTSVAGAMARIEQAYDAIAQRFPGKTIMVAETGWPTAGRTRSAATAGLVEKATFVADFMRLAERRGFDYNIIEAFDQAWKQKLEGTVGGHWGLYDSARQPKFTLGKPVEANPRWPMLFAASTGLAAFLLLGLAVLRGPDAPGRALALTALTFALCDMLVFGVERLLIWKAYPLDLAFGGAVLALETVLLLATLGAARRIMAVRALEVESDRPLLETLGFDTLAQTGLTAAAALGVVAVIWSLLLIFDGRYRDFPNHHLLLVAVALLALGRMRAAKLPYGAPKAAAYALTTLFRPVLAVADFPQSKGLEKLIGWLLVIGAGLTLFAEGFAPVESIIGGQLPVREALHEVDWTRPNAQAWLWAAVQAALAVPFLAAARLGRR